MENPERECRGQRSMSAPPENRQQTNAQQTSQEQDKPQPGQRFVSRVDITPQHNQQSKHQQPQSPPQQQPQSNVRHIPIFVEGRDEPVISKNVDAPFQRQPSPPQFHTTPPHFQKSSPFSQRFGSRQWPPHFQDSFYQPQSTFDHSPTRRTQQQQPRQQYAERQRPEQQQRHQFEPQQQEHQSRQRPQRQQQQEQKPQQQQPQQEAPKPAPKQTLPKDPLERVALVQKEVDSLAEQVKLYTGNSRKDKQYMYLDEMLTRELIKLDDIETEGRENVRQARKNAIKTIQETISLLESKAPLPGQKPPQEEEPQAMQVDQSPDNKEQEEQPSSEKMDVDQNTEQNAQANEAIPLPAAPPSPAKETSENNEPPPEVQTEPQNAPTVDQPVKQEQENQPAENQEQQEQTQPQEQEQQQDGTMMVDKTASENTNSNEVTIQPDTSTPMEVQDKMETVVEEKKDENENVAQEIKTDNAEQKPAEEQKEHAENKEKAKTDKGLNKLTQSPKTIKKAKKQTAPISKEPIPLPPPQNTEASAK